MSNKKSRGVTNKRKGSDAERFYARAFQELGWEHCKTARLGSKLHDDAGIDLIFLPFNVQVKAGKQRGMNTSKILKNMTEGMQHFFPETSIEHDLPKIVIHRKEVGQGKKRTEYDELVTMTWEDFVKILKFKYE